MKFKTSFAIIAGMSLLLGAGCMGASVSKSIPSNTKPQTSPQDVPPNQLQAPKASATTGTGIVTPEQGPEVKKARINTPAPPQGTKPVGGGPALGASE